MLNQMYYATRNKLLMRIIALIITVVGNVFFLILLRGVESDYDWRFVLGIMFASFSFIGLMVVNFITSYNTIAWLFNHPRSYLMELIPVAAWKKLLGTLIPTVLMDMASFFIGFGFIMLVTNSVMHATDDISFWSSIDLSFAYAMLIIIIGYGYLVAVCILSNAFARTVFAKMPISLLWGVIAALASALVLSWTSVVLLPFGEMHRFGPFFAVEIITSSFVPYALSLVLLVAQGAVFIFVSAYLLDRRA